MAGDLNFVTDALRDAWLKGTLSHQRLGELLVPVAHRGGQRQGGGMAMLNHLIELAGVDEKRISRQMLKLRFLSSRIPSPYGYNDSSGPRTALRSERSPCC